MDQNERNYIDTLFDRLRSAEGQSGPRDEEAEHYIRELLSRQPAAPYYMAQTLIVQEEALKNAQARIEELEYQVEDRPAQGRGSFLGGLFGGGEGGSAPQRSSVPSSGSVPQSGGGFSYPRQEQMREPVDDPRAARYGNGGGGGFLAGALQTATGVAGGVLLGNMLGDMFKGHGATSTAAATPSEKPAEQPQQEATKADNNRDYDDDNVQNADYDDYDGGDFDGGGIDI